MVKVRFTRREDRDELLRWRNDPVTRHNSLSSSPISPDDHNDWLESVLADPKRFHYIGVSDQKDIGTVRFDVEENRAEVSIMTAPESRGQGLAGPLLTSAIEKFAQDVHSVDEIIARVRVDNAASFRLFHKAHFVETEREDDVATLSLTNIREHRV